MSRSDRLPFVVQGIARIGIAFLYWTHGAQKLMGWFGGVGANGGAADLMSRFGVAGVIEFCGGLLLMAGLFTRPVAFIVSGEMAVAYFWMHVPGRGLWPWLNRGENVAYYSFAFLMFAAIGGGAFALDNILRKRKQVESRE
jgi:putative oxidoreductase